MVHNHNGILGICKKWWGSMRCTGRERSQDIIKGKSQGAEEGHILYRMEESIPTINLTMRGRGFKK